MPEAGQAVLHDVRAGTPVRSRRLVEVGLRLGRGGWSASMHAFVRTVHAAFGRAGRARRARRGDDGVALGVGLVVSRVSRVAWRGSEMEGDWTR